MTGTELERRGRNPLRGVVRTYELADPPERVLERLGETVPVLSRQEAREHDRPDPFLVATASGFTLYQPWRSRHLRHQFGDDFSMGPAVHGRLVPSGHGTRVELTVRRWAPTPAQQPRFGLGALAGLGLYGIVALGTGLHPLVLALGAAVGLATLAGQTFYRRSERSHDVRELLHIVERTLGPHELPAGDAAPHRLAEPE